MTVPLRARLVDQLHCLSADGAIVMTSQRWTDPDTDDGPRSWLRVIHNGEVRGVMHFTGPRRHEALERQWAELDKLRPAALTEDQMWSKLLELAGVEKRKCQHGQCPGILPVAWTVCPSCGRDARRVTGGQMTRNRRRGADIWWDLRNRSKTL